MCSEELSPHNVVLTGLISMRKQGYGDLKNMPWYGTNPKIKDIEIR